MYQWRKFEFFEEKSKPKMIPSEISSSIPSSSSSSPSPIPSEPEVSIQCCSSGRGRIVIECADGTVGFLDRTFNLLYSFQAHTSSLLFLHQLKKKKKKKKKKKRFHLCFLRCILRGQGERGNLYFWRILGSAYCYDSCQEPCRDKFGLWVSGSSSHVFIILFSTILMYSEGY